MLLVTKLFFKNDFFQHLIRRDKCVFSAAIHSFFFTLCLDRKNKIKEIKCEKERKKSTFQPFSLIYLTIKKLYNIIITFSHGKLIVKEFSFVIEKSFYFLTLFCKSNKKKNCSFFLSHNLNKPS